MTMKRTFTRAAALAGLAMGPACSGTDSFGISGTLSGTCQAGVTLTVSGPASATVTSGADGQYEFTGLPNGDYTVTPSKTGCTFNPVAMLVKVDGKVATGNNFTANAN